MKRFDLVGVDGNAFSVMGYTVNAMKEAYRQARDNEEQDRMVEFNRDAQKQYQTEAMSGDYNKLLCASMDMIDKVNEYLNLDYEEDEDDDYDEDDEDECWE